MIEARAAGAGAEDVAALETELARAAERALGEEMVALRAVAGDDRFREAVSWQNLDARRDAIDSLARTAAGAPRNHNARKRAGLVARYWNRYCSKNDTIGFFGPVCWATIVDSGDPITVEPGPSLLRRRTVYLERWGVAAWAEALFRQPGLREWLPPRLQVHHHLDPQSRALFRPPFPPVPLRPADCGLLGLCDGRRPAREVARLAVADPALGLRREEDALLLLAALAEQKLVVWEVELPLELHPERTVRGLLDAVGDEALRAPAVAGLDRLEEGRAAVAAAAGDADALDRALGDLASAFTDLTGADASRAHGQAYAGRTLVFEDTLRDLDVRVGPGLLASVAPALDLLLTGARWLTAEVGRAYAEVFRQAYDDEAGPGRPVVELGLLWPWLQAALFGTSGRPVDRVLADFAGRWARILGAGGAGPGRGQVRLASADLRAMVEAEFPAQGPGWPGARHHSADLQIDAPSVGALNRGGCDVVLGELHAAWNTLDVTVFVDQHPDPRRLLAAIDADLPQPRVLALVPAGWPRRTGRTVDALVRDDDLHLGWAPAPPPSRGTLLPLGELVVEDTGGALRARTRDGRLTFDPVEVIGSFLSELVVDAYKAAFAGTGDGAHVPRTSIDCLVVSRETWRLALGDLDFAAARSEGERFVGARAWRRRFGLPEHVFVGFAHETKPFGVDLRSPVLVEALAASVRAGTRRDPEAPVVVSEMLPAPGGAWVPDAEGRTYVSELRLQFVDPEPYRRR